MCMCRRIASIVVLIALVAICAPATAQDAVWLRGPDGSRVGVPVDGSGNLKTATVSAALPTGAATSALQTTGNGTLASILSYLSNLATAAKQDAISSALSALSTSALQTTGNGTLASILSALGGTLTVNGSGVTQPVSGTFWQATQPVSGTFWQATQPVSGSFYQATQPVSAAALPLPTGAATSALQLPDGHAVTVDNASIPVTGTFWQSTQPVSAAALPLPSGAATSAIQTDGSQLVQLVGAGGTPVTVADDKLRTISMPYGFAVTEGMLSGHAATGSFGVREAVAVVAQGSDMWNGAATTQPYPVAAGEQLEIISTSVEDDPDKGGAVPGTGIHTVHVHYLDASGDPQVETVNLNGTGAVALTETNVRFVQLVHTTVAGTAGAAVGTVTLYKQGAAATVYGHIAIGSNRTLSAMQMVPAGKTLYITDGFASGADKSVDIRLRATAVAGELIEDIFIAQGVGSIRDTAMVRHMTFPIKIPSLAIVKMTCYVPATKAGADVSGGWAGWIE